MAEPKQHIGDDNCHECGNTVHVLLNKNLIAYYFCGCGAHAKWSRPGSNKLMQAAAKAARKGADNGVSTDSGASGSGDSGGERDRGTAAIGADAGAGKPERRRSILFGS